MSGEAKPPSVTTAFQAPTPTTRGKVLARTVLRGKAQTITPSRPLVARVQMAPMPRYCARPHSLLLWCFLLSTHLASWCLFYTHQSEGFRSCITCASGFFTKHAGASSCSLCGPGFAWSRDGGGGFPACNACEPGSSSTGGISGCLVRTLSHVHPRLLEHARSSPQACGQGRFSSGSGTTTCLSCSRGYFAAANLTVQLECGSPLFYCRDGMRYNVSNNPAFYSTPDGINTSPLRREGQEVCPEGFWCGSGLRKQCVVDQACPKGSFSPTNCSETQYTTTGKQGACVLCPAGHFLTKDPMSRIGTCTACVAGRFTVDSSKECQACPDGFYNSNSGEATCDPAPAGYYVKPGGTEVKSCEGPKEYCAFGLRKEVSAGFYTFVEEVGNGRRLLLSGMTGQRICEPGPSWQLAPLKQCTHLNPHVAQIVRANAQHTCT